MTFTLWNWPFLHWSSSSYIVKNALIDDINTLNVHNTYVIIAINKLRDTEFLIAWDVEAGDFNHSGGYCYKFFPSSTTCRTCFYRLFFIYDRTCIHLKASMPFTYVYHIFILCFTCVCLKANTPSSLFKPVVRQLYSLAFHWEFYCSHSELLDLRQYLAIVSLTWTLAWNLAQFYLTVKHYRQTCSVPNVSTGSLSSFCS